MMKIRDNNNIPKLRKALKELQSMQVEVGVFGDDGSHILMIARVHEFGVSIDVTDKMRGYLAYQGYPLKKETTEINIPERSFVRSTYDEKEKELGLNQEKLVQGVIDLKITPKQAGDRIGQWLVSKIQRQMEDVDDPPNSDMTVERKGSSNPLVDTGRLRQSITWRVV